MAVATAPDRSLEQRMTALKTANDYRTFRAKEKRVIRTAPRPIAEAKIAELIAAPPVQMANMKVLDLLLVIPKVGRVRANRMLTQLHVSPSRTLGGLSERQRNQLIDWLAR